jgi:peptidoglycan hydrolase CwlO-like protein
MTPIQIAVPESLTAQKAELETTLAGIAGEEEQLAAKRNDLQAALQSIATAIAVLSGQPLPASKAVAGIATARKPMSDEAKKRIGEGLRKYREAKALAKAAQLAASAPQGSAPANEFAEVSAPAMTVEVPADAPVLVSAPQEPAQAPADVPVADTDRKPRSSRKAAKE